MKELIGFIKENLGHTVTEISVSTSTLRGTRLFFISEEGAALLYFREGKIQSSLPLREATLLKEYLVSQLG